MNSHDDNAARHATVLDTNEQRIAKVYAEALLAAAAKQNQTADILEEYAALLNDVFGPNPQFEVSIASSVVSRHAKAEVLKRVFGGRVSELFLNFLLVLNDHQRLDLLRGIYQAARQLYDESQGRVPVLVRSAVPLHDDQRERLLNELRQKFHKEPVLETQVDPALLGGLVVKVGDWLYDASVRTRLDNIKKHLIENSR
jgi:F-type H+-transporting ATPase subunit delta